MSLTLARPYARAAFGIARSQGDLAGWSGRLGQAAHIAADPRVASLLGHPQLARAEAVALLAGEDVDARFGDFLGLLADNHRLGLLTDIAALFEQLRAEAENVVRARITSAAALPAEQLEGIRAGLRRRFGREVQIETELDPALIGGAIIDAGDVVIDGSLRSRLARMQSALAQ